MALPRRAERFDPLSVKEVQFDQPMLEFSGVCEGCGETPYMKLLTQLFGRRLIIANTKGCSSIWGATAGWIPYTSDKKTGKGIAWGNSLFENDAEYGLGMVLSMKQRRTLLTEHVQAAVEAKAGTVEEQSVPSQWLERKDDTDVSEILDDQLQALLKPQAEANTLDPKLKEVWRLRDLLTKPSMWMMGGDRWTNDVGYGGIDYATALGEDTNLQQCVEAMQ